MPFRTDIVVRETGVTGVWSLVEPVEYEHALFTVIVPAGFDTDFASVPRALWWLLPPFGKHQRAAVVHDRLYQTPGMCSRRMADTIFLDAMRESGVSWWRRVAMWAGVRLGGWVPWRRYRRATG